MEYLQGMEIVYCRDNLEHRKKYHLHMTYSKDSY